MVAVVTDGTAVLGLGVSLMEGWYAGYGKNALYLRNICGCRCFSFMHTQQRSG